MKGRRDSVLILLLLLGFAGVGLAAEAPVAGSPGTATGALIGDTCPTFSWGAVPGAKNYELVVYLLTEEGEDAARILRRTFAGSVHSWTPSLDLCLGRGAQYAWSVRAVGRKKASDWSPPSLFQVASGPSAAELEGALEVVRRYLGPTEPTEPADTSSSQALVSSTATEPVTGASSMGITEPTPRSHAGTGTGGGIVVNGAVAETKADPPCYPSGGFDRFIDCGNGTVLDTVTGLLWLKEANCRTCVTVPPCPPEDGERTWYAANAFAATVRDGTCSLSDHSQAGDWRVPTKAEWEAILAPSCTDPPEITGKSRACYADPGQAWAFEVQSSGLYWSSTTFAADNEFAWGVSLLNGSAKDDDKTDSRHVWPVRGGQ